jgi:signal transduction histidine kinase
MPQAVGVAISTAYARTEMWDIRRTCRAPGAAVCPGVMDNGRRQTSESAWAVRWAMAAVVVSFTGGTVFTQYLLHSEVVATDISGNAAPGVVLLADARADLRAVERAMHNHPGDYPGARRRLDETLARYRATPDFPGEAALFAAVPGMLARLDERFAARSPEADGVMDQLDRRLRELMELNRAELHQSIAALVRHERISNRWAVTLDGVAIGIAVLATWLVSRTVARYLGALARRSRELELLAVQVGHEIANPLVPLQAAVALGGERAPPDEVAVYERAARSLERIRASLDRLVEFAEATRPPAGAIAPSPLKPALEEAGVAATGDLDATVACAPATLAAVVHDLVAAAHPTRLEVRSSRRGVRVSLESDGDAGDGNPFDPELFEEGSGRPGIDLRLAAVRRRVEAHGGTVGYRRARGRRTLWIELPGA